MSTLDSSLNPSILPPKEDSYNLRYKWHFLVFMIMGSGANWVFPTALAQEIPYFEDHQPEGLCIATYMNAATNFGLIALGIYVYIYNNVYRIPYSYSVPLLLSLSSVGCFITASLYRVTVGDVSIMLYICCAIGGTVGALAAVIMSPFLMSYENNMISAARSGGSAMILLTAIVSAIQAPGSYDRMSVTVYMIIFGVLLAFPIVAYYYIMREEIGLRSKQVVEMELSKHDSKMILGSLASIENPLISTTHPDRNDDSHHNSNGDHNMNRRVSDDLSLKSIDIRTDEESKSSPSSGPSPIYSMEDNSGQQPSDDISKIYIYGKSNNRIDTFIHDLFEFIIPISIQKQYPWFVQVIPYMLAVAWADFHTWGVLTAALPFAIAVTSPGDGSGNLAIAYEVGSFCLVSGDLTTTLFQIPYRYALSIFTICSLIIYLAAFNTSGFQTSAATPFVIICYCATQYTEAHMLTSAYRACASKFPHQYREDASRAVGIADQIGTCLGAIVSTVLISKIVNC